MDSMESGDAMETLDSMDYMDCLRSMDSMASMNYVDFIDSVDYIIRYAYLICKYGKINEAKTIWQYTNYMAHAKKPVARLRGNRLPIVGKPMPPSKAMQFFKRSKNLVSNAG